MKLIIALLSLTTLVSAHPHRPFDETAIPEACQPDANDNEPNIEDCLLAIEEEVSGLAFLPDGCVEALDGAESIHDLKPCFRAIALLSNLPEECQDIQDEDDLKECLREAHGYIHKAPGCFRKSKRALRKCLLENRETCSETCQGIDFSFERPPLGSLETCNDIQDLVIDQFCEVTTCCDACSDLFLQFSECVVNRAINQTGTECSFECSANDASTEAVSTATESALEDFTTSTVAADPDTQGSRRLGSNSDSQDSSSDSSDSDNSSDSSDSDSRSDSSDESSDGESEICGTDSLDGQPADMETFIEESLCVLGEYEAIIDGTSEFVTVESELGSGSESILSRGTMIASAFMVLFAFIQ